MAEQETYDVGWALMEMLAGRAVRGVEFEGDENLRTIAETIWLFDGEVQVSERALCDYYQMRFTPYVVPKPKPKTAGRRIAECFPFNEKRRAKAEEQIDAAIFEAVKKAREDQRREDVELLRGHGFNNSPDWLAGEPLEPAEQV